MLMETCLWAALGVQSALLLAQTLWLRQARKKLEAVLATRYGLYQREGLQLLEAAGSSGARGLTTQAAEQEKLAREWFVRADAQPDAPVERRALHELAQIE